MTFGALPSAVVATASASCCAFLHKQRESSPAASALTPATGSDGNESDMAVDEGEGGAPSAGDVSTFVFMHTVLSAILVSSTWYLAYSLSSPARVPNLGQGRLGACFATIGKSLSKLIPQSIRGWYQRTNASLSSKAEAAALKSKSIQRLQTQFPNLDGPRIVTSYVEAKIVRLFFKPITVPGRIWMSWRMTKWWSRWWEEIRREVEEESGCFKGIEELTMRGVDDVNRVDRTRVGVTC